MSKIPQRQERFAPKGFSARKSLVLDLAPLGRKSHHQPIGGDREFGAHQANRALVFEPGPIPSEIDPLIKFFPLVLLVIARSHNPATSNERTNTAPQQKPHNLDYICSIYTDRQCQAISGYLLHTIVEFLT